MTSGAFLLRIWCDQPSPIVVPTHPAPLEGSLVHYTFHMFRWEMHKPRFFGSTSRISTYQYPAKQDSLKTTRWSSSYKEPMYSMYVLNYPGPTFSTLNLSKSGDIYVSISILFDIWILTCILFGRHGAMHLSKWVRHPGCIFVAKRRSRFAEAFSRILMMSCFRLKLAPLCVFQGPIWTVSTFHRFHDFQLLPHANHPVIQCTKRSLAASAFCCRDIDATPGSYSS